MSTLRRPAGVDALRAALHALWRRARGQATGSYRAQAERLLDLDARRQEAVLIARLRGLLVHANATVPHYRRAFAEAGFQPHRFPCVSRRDRVRNPRAPGGGLPRYPGPQNHGYQRQPRR